MSIKTVFSSGFQTFCLLWSVLSVTTLAGLSGGQHVHRHRQKLSGVGSLRPSIKTRGDDLLLNINEDQKLEDVRNLEKLLLIFDTDCVKTVEEAQLILSVIESQFDCLFESSLNSAVVYSNPHLNDLHAYLDIYDAGSCLDQDIDYERFCLAGVDYEPLVLQLAQQYVDEEPYGGHTFDGSNGDETYLWSLDALDGTLDELYSYVVASGALDLDIYVIDSGVLASHVEFDAIPVVHMDPNWPDDLVGHGTHVAGIIIGNTVGVAKGLSTAETNITLYEYNVIRNGSGPTVFFQTFEDAMNAVIDNLNTTNRRGVINLSLGWFSDGSGLPNNSIPWAVEEIEAYFETMVDVGGIPVAAASNEGIDACFVHPASIEHSITVGSTEQVLTKDGIFAVSFFSNHGDCVDVYAPGRDIYSSYSFGNNTYLVDSGTSMASPYVAGIVAQMLAVNDQLTFDEILDILTRPGNSIEALSCPHVNNQTCNQIKFESAQDLANQAMLASNYPTGVPTLAPTCGVEARFVNVEIVHDLYRQDTLWEVVGRDDGVLHGMSTESGSVCVDSSDPGVCLIFIIFDFGYNGLCCSSGNGSYTLDVDGTVLATGDKFEQNETTVFCLKDNQTTLVGDDGDEDEDEEDDEEKDAAFNNTPFAVVLMLVVWLVDEMQML